MLEVPAGFVLLEELGRTADVRWLHAVDPEGHEVALVLYSLRSNDFDGPELTARLDDLETLDQELVLPRLGLGNAGSVAWTTSVWSGRCSLQDELEGQVRPWREALPIVLTLLEGLSDLHRRGFIHGAIDAWTVRLDKDDQPRLLGPAPVGTSTEVDLRGVAGLLVQFLERSARMSGSGTEKDSARWAPRPELLELAVQTRDGAPGAPTTASSFAGRIRATIERSHPAKPTVAEFTQPTGGGASAEVDPLATAMIGRELAGYRIQALLGRGGMGVVFKAWDPHLNRPLAVKIIRPELVEGTQAKERFQREVRAASRVNHPNLVTVYSAGEERGAPYLAMEFVQGRTLRSALKEMELDWRQKVRWVVDLLGGLAPLHEQGIIHRDIKPDNILVSEEGVPKLTDFGLAKVATSAPLTQVGSQLGTFKYMSPEQVSGANVHAGTDVFSLAVVLYEMLAGRLPFEGDTNQSVLGQILHADPAPLPVKDIGCPPELAGVIGRALAKDQEQRYANAAEFRKALLEVLGEGLQAAPPPLSARRLSLAAIAVLGGAGLLFWISTIADPPLCGNRAQASQLNELGVEAVSRGQVDVALTHLREATVADPCYAEAWANLAHLESRRGRDAVADSLYRHAIELEGTPAAAYANLGGLLAEQGNWAEADSIYRVGIEAVPDPGYVYNNLGYLLHERGRLDEARAVLEEGLGRTSLEDGAYPYLLRTLGRVEAAAGRFEEALERWGRAREMLPASQRPEVDQLMEQVRDRGANSADG